MQPINTHITELEPLADNIQMKGTNETKECVEDNCLRNLWL